MKSISSCHYMEIRKENFFWLWQLKKVNQIVAGICAANRPLGYIACSKLSHRCHFECSNIFWNTARHLLFCQEQIFTPFTSNGAWKCSAIVLPLDLISYKPSSSELTSLIGAELFWNVQFSVSKKRLLQAVQCLTIPNRFRAFHLKM